MTSTAPGHDDDERVPTRAEVQAAADALAEAVVTAVEDLAGAIVGAVEGLATALFGPVRSHGERAVAKEAARDAELEAMLETDRRAAWHRARAEAGLRPLPTRPNPGVTEAGSPPRGQWVDFGTDPPTIRGVE